jgi:hypothetical protein
VLNDTVRHESDDRFVRVQLTEACPNQPEANDDGKHDARREHHDIDCRECTVRVTRFRLGGLAHLRHHAATLTHQVGAQ